MPGLYIHVPFCRTKCAYCDFYSLPGIEKYANRYISALEKEWTLRKSEIEAPHTIYIGGGTPSSLPIDAFDKIKHILSQISDFGEFTIEVNPEDVNITKINKWLDLGINRISMGVQSLNDCELAKVGRRHTESEAIKAYQILRENFNNISLDIIIGLPGQTLQSLESTLQKLIELKPEHISAYILSYEEGTRLWAMRKIGKISETEEDTIVAMYDLVCQTLDNAGYEHYEISNFALPGKRAQHNSSYWEGSAYLGLGPAAHSFDGSVRRVNPSNIKSWLTAIEGGTIAYTVEPESLTDKINNQIMIKLRTKEGLDLKALPLSVCEYLSLRIDKLSKFGRICRENDRIYIPERQWIVSDDTIAELFLED